jgi:competence protein ComEC
LATLILWVQTPLPAILIADSGGLMGVMGAGGRALSTAIGDGFVAGIWLETDGALVPQDLAADRPGLISQARGQPCG